jgi:hypothetical protein
MRNSLLAKIVSVGTLGILANFWQQPSAFAQTVLFQEFFEDSDIASRGWYDNVTVQLSATEHIPGSTKSAEFYWPTGSRTPTAAGFRKKFLESESAYVSYYVKYSQNYTGMNMSYGPHEFLMLTNLNGDYSGLAYTHLTAYIEHNAGAVDIGADEIVSNDTTPPKAPTNLRVS